MFDRLSRRYDLFNRLTSLGQDIRWRREALTVLKKGMRVLDVGCGTGDLSILAAEKMGQSDGSEVVGIDFSPQMLQVAEERKKKLKPNSAKIHFLCRRAEDLPMERDCYDLVVSAFVLRNIYENIDWILKGICTSLKSDGRVSFLDFTEPADPMRRFMWKGYMNTVVNVYGWAIFGKDFPTHYMAESAKRFVNPPEFIKKLELAGFKDIQSRFFMLDSIVLYQAQKK